MADIDLTSAEVATYSEIAARDGDIMAIKAYREATLADLRTAYERLGRAGVIRPRVWGARRSRVMATDVGGAWRAEIRLSAEAAVRDHDTLDLAGLTAEAVRLGYVREYRGWAERDTGLLWLRSDAMGGWHLWAVGEPVSDEAAALRWLLATPEARRLAAIVDAAEARARAAERADVVAWLRSSRPWRYADGDDAASLAEAIERGEPVGASAPEQVRHELRRPRPDGATE